MESLIRKDYFDYFLKNMSVECMPVSHIYVTVDVQIQEILDHTYTLCLPAISR